MNINVFGVHISISRGKSHPQTVSVPDFMQEAKEQALRFVPKGNSKEAYLLSRFAHLTGALREFIRANPHMRENPEVLRQITAGTHLAHQVGVFEVSVAQKTLEAYQVALKNLLDPKYGLMPDVVQYINRVLRENNQ